MAPVIPIRVPAPDSPRNRRLVRVSMDNRAVLLTVAIGEVDHSVRLGVHSALQLSADIIDAVVAVTAGRRR